MTRTILLICIAGTVCIPTCVAAQQKQPGFEEATVGKHEGYAHAVRFSPNGKQLVSSGHQDSLVMVWDVGARKQLHKLAGHTGGAMSVTFSPDGKLIASAGMGDGVRLWAVETGKEVLRINAPNHSYAVSFSPDGKTLASGGIDRVIRTWEVATGKELRQIGGHTGRIWAVSFSPDGKRLASGDETGSVRVWDSSNGREISTCAGHQGGVIPVVFSPNGKVLASAGADGQIRLWDPTTGKELSSLRGHSGMVHDARFSPDGRLLVSCGWEDKTVRVWEMATEKEVFQITAHTGEVGGVAFAPDGRSVASAGRDSAVRVWDITGRAKDGKLQPLQLKPKELEAAWKELQGEKADIAYRASWTLIASPKETVAYLKEQLKAVTAEPESAKKIAELIRELGDQKFGVRERASHLLGKMGRMAEPALRKALDTETSAEVRSRVKALLDKLEGNAIPTEAVPGIRAVRVLEEIGTPEARQLLKELAGGLPEAWITQEARDSLGRLSSR